MRILYVECNMGIAGDMLMASLFEVLPDKQLFLDMINSAGIPHVKVSAETKKSCGISGTHMRVEVHGHEEHEHSHGHSHEHTHSHHHATPTNIYSIIDGLNLSETVRKNAKEIYADIARAESKVHGETVELIHFHEVGALDAIADVVGVCLAMELLAPHKTVFSPIRTGFGSVKCAHGIVPVPAPATAELLCGVPTYSGDIEGEMCTPTGAALAHFFADEFQNSPVMHTQKIGYGMGTKEFRMANCVRSFLGETGVYKTDQVAEISCNIDDMTAEELSFASEKLMSEGALDVLTLPAFMKKGRAGFVLNVLCKAGEEQNFSELILKHTSTNGVRIKTMKRIKLESSFRMLETEYGIVRIKKSEGYGITHEKAEFEDIAKICRENDLSYKEVLEKLK